MNERNDLVQSDNDETTSTPLQPMSFVDILDGMFSLYRSHFHLFFRIVVVYFVFGFLINLISTAVVIGDTSITAVVITVLASIAGVLFAYWIGWGLAYASTQVYLTRDITSQAALQQASKSYLRLLGSMFLYYLVVVCLSITIIGIPFAIYFAFRWGLFAFPILFEETTLRNALRRSTELVKGTWWRVCGIIIAIFLIAFMIAFILQTSYAIIFYSLAGAESAADANFVETLRRLFAPSPNDIGWGLYITHALGTLIIGGLTMPISTIGFSLLYFDLRIRKEAFDIEMQVTD
ncbi:MAG: hypothetical protein OXU51_03910 [Candidatus Poribacteria bacterium]|nr:hypothetical protein [Candidatus Poribacteria bacterium]